MGAKPAKSLFCTICHYYLAAAAADWVWPGEPDVDYPIQAAVQETAFSCAGLVFGGYYADPETRCQQYSVCLQVTTNISEHI